MSKFILWINFVLALTAIAGTGGTVGGVSESRGQENYITVEICGGEAGVNCYKARIKKVPDSDHENEDCMIMQGEAYGSFCQSKTSVNWWRNLYKKLREDQK